MTVRFWKFGPLRYTRFYQCRVLSLARVNLFVAIGKVWDVLGIRAALSEMFDELTPNWMRRAPERNAVATGWDFGKDAGERTVTIHKHHIGGGKLITIHPKEFWECC